MLYIDKNGDTKSVSPTEEWRSVVGYWVDEDGQLFNFAEAIAARGGELMFENPKQKALALFALNYAKQRREQMKNALTVEIAQLERAIENLK
ncbi:MAG: hypothetical protein E7425_07770 [Ruminococcaceae bacterium]|nr:hypothetical protein [Oscillospiraceae bacterium]